MPTIQYFASRGRAEPVRLCYSLKGVAWKEEHVGVDITDMHTNKEAFTYGQCPRLVEDDGFAIVQSLAILRHVGPRSICTARHRKRPARNSVLVPQTSRTS